MRWEPAVCRAGDMVRIRLGSFYHYGIFVSEDEVIQFGLPPTAENRAVEGEVRVLATDIDVFACGCIVETAVPDKSEQKRRLSRDETVRRARARLGEGGYNILHNNCEHFVNACVFGEARCTQEEDVRRRWLNRPICDVYLAKIPATVADEGIFPERRRAEINAIASPELRHSARFLWQLLEVAAKRSFNTDLQAAGLKRKLGGRWVSDKFFFSLQAENGIAAAVVSNAAVSVSFDSRQGVRRTLREPHVTVAVEGKQSGFAKYFWVDNGTASLMGDAAFEQG